MTEEEKAERLKEIEKQNKLDTWQERLNRLSENEQIISAHSAARKQAESDLDKILESAKITPTDFISNTRGVDTTNALNVLGSSISQNGALNTFKKMLNANDKETRTLINNYEQLLSKQPETMEEYYRNEALAELIKGRLEEKNSGLLSKKENLEKTALLGLQNFVTNSTNALLARSIDAAYDDGSIIKRVDPETEAKKKELLNTGRDLLTREGEQRIAYQQKYNDIATSGVEKLALDAGFTLGDMAIPILIGIATGNGVSAAAEGAQLSQAASLAAMYNEVYGSAYTQAIDKGTTPTRAKTYANAIAGVETFTEILGGETILSAMAGRPAESLIGKLVSDKVIGKVKGNLAKGIIAFVTDVGGESVEEFLSGLADPVLEKSILGGKDVDASDLLADAYSDALGAILPSLILGGLGKPVMLNQINKSEAMMLDKIEKATWLSNDTKSDMIRKIKEVSSNARIGVNDKYNDTFDAVQGEIASRLGNNMQIMSNASTIQRLTGISDAEALRLAESQGFVYNPTRMTTQEILDTTTKQETNYSEAITKDIEKLLGSDKSLTSITPVTETNKAKQNIANVVSGLTDGQVVFANIETNNGTKVYGLTNGTNIYINAELNDKDTLAAAFHELGHIYAEKNPQEFEAYKSAFYKENKNAEQILKDYNNTIGKYETSENLTEEQKDYLLEELFGDYVGQTMSQTKNTKTLEDSKKNMFDKLKQYGDELKSKYLGTERSNTDISEYNLDEASYLDTELVSDENLENQVVGMFTDKPIDQVKEATKKTKEILKDDVKSRIEEKYKAFDKKLVNMKDVKQMIANELGVEYNNPQVDKIYKQLRDYGEIGERTKLSTRFTVNNGDSIETVFEKAKNSEIYQRFQNEFKNKRDARIIAKFWHKEFDNTNLSFGKQLTKTDFDGFKTKTETDNDVFIYGEEQGYGHQSADELAEYKNIIYANVLVMSPMEYLNICSKYSWRCLVESAVLSADAEKVHKYAERMRRGEKAPMPYVVLDGFQEGRHRALAAIEAGIEEMPVLVMIKEDADERIVENEKNQLPRKSYRDTSEGLVLFETESRETGGGPYIRSEESRAGESGSKDSSSSGGNKRIHGGNGTKFSTRKESNTERITNNQAEENTSKEEEKNALKDKLRKLVARVQEEYSNVEELSKEEAEQYIKLNREVSDIIYNLEKNYYKEISEKNIKDERLTSLDKNVYVQARKDLLSNKDIYDAMQEASFGVFFNSNTPVDDIMEGKNKEVTVEELYNAFNKTRELLKKQYGDTITLYRVEGLQKPKAVKNYGSSLAYTKQYGSNVKPYNIKVKDIIAINTNRSGTYEDIIVASNGIDNYLKKEPTENSDTRFSKRKGEFDRDKVINNQLNKIAEQQEKIEELEAENKGLRNINKGIKSTGRQQIKNVQSESNKMLKTGREQELKMRGQLERAGKKYNRLSEAAIDIKYENQLAEKARVDGISYPREYKDLFIGLRRAGDSIKEAYATTKSIFDESQVVNRSIDESISILKEIRKRKLYNKLPNEIKAKINEYDKIWTGSRQQSNLTLAKRVLASLKAREMLGNIAMTKGVRNQIMSMEGYGWENGKGSVSLKELFNESKELALKFQQELLDLRKEIADFQAIDKNKERATQIKGTIDSSQEAVLTEEKKQDKLKIKGLTKKVTNKTLFNSLMTLKTEIQALMGGNINTPLMAINNNLQNGELRKKQSIVEMYRILSDFMRKSSGINRALGTQRWSKSLEKSLSNSSEWIDTGYKVKAERGGTSTIIELKLPRSMAMSLAMHLLNDDNMLHISGGAVQITVDDNGNVDVKRGEGKGVRIPDENLFRQGKEEQAYHRGATVKLTHEQVEKIANMLTAEEKAFVKATQEVFKYTTELINEVSNRVFGYDLATVENYFPIRVWDKGESKGAVINAPMQKMYGDALSHMLNPGWLQQRVTSFNPIYLENIAEVLNRTMNNVANFYGYAEALRDNHLILDSTMPDGTEFSKHIDYLSSDFMSDYNRLTRFITGQEALRDGKFRGLMAMNTLTFNVGTWLTQPMSFFNTLKYFNSKEFLSGINPINNNIKLNNMIRNYFKELGIDDTKYDDYQVARAFIAMATPNLDYRALGYKIPELNQLFNKTMQQKIGAHGIEAFDNIAVTAIARMMAYAVSLDKSIKFGSERYFEVLGDRLTKALVETQPEYSQINRANMFRSTNPILRTLSLFGTPANQMFNNFAQSMMEFRYELREGNKEGIKAARVDLAKSISGIILSSVMVGLIRALRDKARDDDDKVDFRDRWIAQSTIAALGPTLVLDDLAQLIMSTNNFGGVSSYDFNTPETTFLNGFSNLYNKSLQLFKEDVSPAKKTTDLIKAIGVITPIDTKDVIRVTTMLMKTMAPDMYSAYKLQQDSTVYKKWLENSDTDMATFYKAYTATREKNLTENYGYHKADKAKGIKSNLKEAREKALKDVLKNQKEVDKYMELLFNYKKAEG